MDVEDVLGRHAIHHAAQAGALRALECLIRLGADVNKLASVNNIAPLHYAAKAGGGLGGGREGGGHTGLTCSGYWALQEGQAGAISLLLQHGADPTVRDKRGRTG